MHIILDHSPWFKELHIVNLIYKIINKEDKKEV